MGLQTRDLAKYLSAAVITTKNQAVALLVAGASGGRVAVYDGVITTVNSLFVRQIA